MAITPKVLAEGQVANTKTTIYTVPALTSAYVKYASFFNTSPTPQTVVLYINASGTSRVLRRAVLAQNEQMIVDQPVTLETGDTLEAETTTASVVDYVVTGAEET